MRTWIGGALLATLACDADTPRSATPPVAGTFPPEATRPALDSGIRG